LNDIFELLTEQELTLSRWQGMVVLTSCIGDFVCSLVAVEMWRVLHGMVSFQRPLPVTAATHLTRDPLEALRQLPAHRPVSERRSSAARDAFVRNLSLPSTPVLKPSSRPPSFRSTMPQPCHEGASAGVDGSSKNWFKNVFGQG
ncbi:unnamed protein product, partial [Polarella glacialis]